MNENEARKIGHILNQNDRVKKCIDSLSAETHEGRCDAICEFIELSQLSEDDVEEIANLIKSKMEKYYNKIKADAKKSGLVL